MNRSATISLRTSNRPGAFDEFVGWAVGLAFTFGLFFALAHFENLAPQEPPSEIEDVRMVSLPFDTPPPPPKTVEPRTTADDTPPLAGIEAGASDSPVRIAVVPRDLEALLPPEQTPPKAAVQFGKLFADLKPKTEIDFDVNHVFQANEVDQKAHAVIRVAPKVPNYVWGKQQSLRVLLMLVIGPKGKVESARIVESSGQPEFDSIVMKTVKDEWDFSPAIKHGKRVRCLALQPVRVSMSAGGSPFELP